MTWPSTFSWQSAGENWNDISNSGATAEGQSAVGTGAVQFTGAAQSAESQHSVAAGRMKITGGVISGQAQTAVATAVLKLIGRVVTAEGQSAIGYSHTIAGVGHSRQSQHTASSSKVLIIGHGTTAEGQIATVYARQVFAGPVVTGNTQHASLSGALRISGVGDTSTGQHANARGLFDDGHMPLEDELARLLKYPHKAVFDIDASADWAISFDGGNSLSWSVANGILTVTTSGAPIPFDLKGNTVESLASQMRACGLSFTLNSSTFSMFSAERLLAASGHGDDRVMGFTSLLWSLFYAYAHEMIDLKYQVGQALRQMVITQAEGEWLDVWGTLYGVPRRQGETDSVFAPRIPRDVFRLRENPRAIEIAIKQDTGFDVKITEPWQDIFTLDESVLSGPHKFYDGATIGYHLIKPVSRDAIDWPAVLAVIDRNRAAGVIVLGPDIDLGYLVDGSGAVVTVGVISNDGSLVSYSDRALLDYSTIEETSIPNYDALYLQTVLYGSYTVVSGYTTMANFSIEYQIYQLFVEYISQSWTPVASWASTSSSWSDMNAIVLSGYFES